MSGEPRPDEQGRLLQFIASTVELTRDRVDSLSGRVDSNHNSLSGRVDSLKDELRAQTAAVRGDIERVQLPLDSMERGLGARMGQIEADLSRLRSAVYLLSKERPEILRMLGQ